MNREITRRDQDGQRRDENATQLATPGKSTLVETIARRASSGDDVVRADAGESIDRAAQSQGAPLPAALRAQFEQSIGADLSDVRVHTGADSVAAADAVSARAYTIGSDVHFNEGELDLDSRDGQHLLAHEVAHTVQQRGGTPAPQFKLEVSLPGDTHELEADRAADAMLAGRAAEVSSVSGVQRQVQRKNDANDMKTSAAEYGGENGKAGLFKWRSEQGDHVDTGDAQHRDQTVMAGKVTTVGDVEGAKAMIATLEASNKEIEAAGEVEARVTNQQTQQEIERLIDLLSQTDIEAGQFQGQYRESVRDFDRINGALEALKANHPELSSLSVDETTSNVTISDPETMVQQMEKAEGVTQAKTDILTSDDNLGVAEGQAETALSTAVAQVNACEQGIHNAMADVRIAGNAFSAGLKRPAQPDDMPNIQKVNAKIAAVRGAAEQIIATVSPVLKTVANAMSGLPLGESTVGETAKDVKEGLEKTSGDTAQKAVESLPDSIIDAAFEEAKTAAEMKDLPEQVVKDWNFNEQAINSLAKAKDVLKQQVGNYKDAVAAVEKAKTEIRNRAATMGQAADKKTGSNGGFAALGVLLGESKAFIAQADVVIKTGENEQMSEDQARGQRGQIVGEGSKEDWRGRATGAKSWWSMEEVPPGARSFAYWNDHEIKNGKIATENKVNIGELQGQRNNMLYSSGSAESKSGADVKKDLLEDLKAKKAMMEKIAKSVEAAFGRA